MNIDPYLVSDIMGRIGWILSGASIALALVILCYVLYHVGRNTVRRIMGGER